MRPSPMAARCGSCPRPQMQGSRRQLLASYPSMRRFAGPWVEHKRGLATHADGRATHPLSQDSLARVASAVSSTSVEQPRRVPNGASGKFFSLILAKLRLTHSSGESGRGGVGERRER
ncbi:hypothetical protein NL676_022609 [Syzygium grande]|nr:hypothetical protein NL676_022609 [Syzygium grande]